jgi:uracil-DNA glycosylase
LCPRLAEFRSRWQREEPDWFNAPVPTFAPRSHQDVNLLIVGLAPGLRGANRTGRPFTGDFAGDLLYSTLLEYGLAVGSYGADPDDSLALVDCAITNAARCVPPDNKPLGGEVANCRRFLAETIGQYRGLRGIATLGRIAHDSTIRALGRRPADAPFSHGGKADIAGLRIFSSYHCSRYNTNTGRLTPQMFSDVFHEIVKFLRK